MYQNLINQISDCQSKQDGKDLLKGYKKAELTAIAKELNIRVLSNDSKGKIINLITELLLGLKLRRKLFDEINTKK